MHWFEAISARIFCYLTFYVGRLSVVTLCSRLINGELLFSKKKNTMNLTVFKKVLSRCSQIH